MNSSHLREKVLEVNSDNFEELAMEIFQYQSTNCRVYKQYLETLGVASTKITKSEDITFLPIELFKTHIISDHDTQDFDLIFESSSTSQTGLSKHYIPEAAFFEKSNRISFQHFFGPPEEFCHLGLLPAYLERENSSLVKQVSLFIQQSKFSQSGFYLYNHEELQ